MSGWFRLEQLRARALLGVRARLGLARTTYVDQRTEEYRGYWAEGARLIGAEFVDLLPGIWEVRRDGRSIRLANHVAPFDDAATRRLAGDKLYCYGLARDAGVPVPAHLGLTVEHLDAARAFFRDHTPPFVVKPASDSASALGVTTHVSGWREFRRAAALASLYEGRLLLEKMVAGESCRLLFLNGRMIHAVRRCGVPSEGTRELRTVYDEVVTHLCAPSLISQLARVVRAVGSEFAGIDVITNDLGVPLEASGGTFLEINTTPGIHHHYLAEPVPGVQPVAQQVLAYLFRARP